MKRHAPCAPFGENALKVYHRARQTATHSEGSTDRSQVERQVDTHTASFFRQTFSQITEGSVDGGTFIVP